MKPSDTTRKFFPIRSLQLLLLLFLIGLGSIGCSTSVTGIAPTPSKSAVVETIETPNVSAPTTTFPTLVSTPEYIMFVHPELYSLEEYDASRESDFCMVRGIAVSFWVGVNDGVKDGELFRASWGLKLDRGLHKATFTIITDSGKSAGFD